MGGPFGVVFTEGDGQPPDALSDTAQVLAALHAPLVAAQRDA